MRAATFIFRARLHPPRHENNMQPNTNQSACYTSNLDASKGGQRRCAANKGRRRAEEAGPVTPGGERGCSGWNGWHAQARLAGSGRRLAFLHVLPAHDLISSGESFGYLQTPSARQWRAPHARQPRQRQRDSNTARQVHRAVSPPPTPSRATHAACACAHQGAGERNALPSSACAGC